MTRLRIVSAALAAIGVAITGYLTVAHYDGARLVCPTSGCETVQHSRYADVAGVPVALLGLLGFVGILVAALSSHPLAPAAGALLTLSAFLFSGYLLVVQLAAIHAVCTWCVTGDVVTTALLVLAWLRYRDATTSGLAAAPGPRSGRGSRTAPRRSR